MGYELRRALREALGPEVTGLQRAVALEIADDARNETRESWASLEDLARWTGAKSEEVIRTTLKRLGAQGWEFRVPLGVAKDGRIQYAVPGKKLRFRVPPFEGVAPATPQGVTTVPPIDPKEEPGFPEKEPGLPLGVTGVPDEGTGVTPFSSCSSEISSSLSAGPPVTTASQEEGEREDLTEDEPQEPVREVDQFIARLMADYAATADEVAAVLAGAERDGIKSTAAWMSRDAGRYDFPRRLAEHRARAAFAADRLARRSTCGHSDIKDPLAPAGWGSCQLCNDNRRRAELEKVAGPVDNPRESLRATVDRIAAEARNKRHDLTIPVPEPAPLDAKTFARREANFPKIALDQDEERASA